MLLKANFIDSNTLEVEYDKEAQDDLIRAGVLASIHHMIDQEKIAELEAKVRKLKCKLNSYRTRKSRTRK